MKFKKAFGYINPFHIKVRKSGFSFGVDFRFVLPDKRDLRFFKQQVVRGWDDSDTWNLEYTIAEFIVPRLKRFRELAGAYPGCFESFEEWEEVLDKMIFAFENIIANECGANDFRENETEGQRMQRAQRTREGLKLFADYFQGLWW